MIVETCVLPDIPAELVMNEIPERVGEGTILTFSCADLSEEIAQESVLVCGSDGIWRGEFPKCSSKCVRVSMCGSLCVCESVCECRCLCLCVSVCVCVFVCVHIIMYTCVHIIITVWSLCK